MTIQDFHESVRQLQTDLQKLEERSEKWQVPFNLRKYKMMHNGHANPRSDFSLVESHIETTDLEKDLGVLITDDQKLSKQYLEKD